MLWERLRALLALMWGWNAPTGAEGVVEEKSNPKMDISAERRTTSRPGCWEWASSLGEECGSGAEPSCPSTGVPRAGFGDMDAISGCPSPCSQVDQELSDGFRGCGADLGKPELLASPTPALQGFPLQPNGKGEGQGVVQALGLMREPPLP